MYQKKYVLMFFCQKEKNVLMSKKEKICTISMKS